MFIRPCYRRKGRKRHAYWALVESHRTVRGPRQRVVAYLGLLGAPARRGLRLAAQGLPQVGEAELFEGEPVEWAEVDAKRVRVEHSRAYGGPWLGLQLVRRLGLDRFLEQVLPEGREEIPWPAMALALVLCRLCHPSSELEIAESFYRSSALAELLGVPAEKVNEDRLYRALDALLPHKAELEQFLKERLGALFGVSYDLLLYDVTSTYFEGQAEGNPLAQRGYSRDGRPECKQVCIALVVSRCGLPLGYEVFAGNRTDVTTLQEIVTTMEARYGLAERIWVVDRGMVSRTNLAFLQEEGRRYIVGAPRSELKALAGALRGGDWQALREDVEVKVVAAPQGAETLILCRSGARRAKERAQHARFEARIEQGLARLAGRLAQARRAERVQVERQVGRLLQRNARAAGLFEIQVRASTAAEGAGGLRVEWTKRESWREWAELSEGCYLLRSNVREWSAEELWQAYMQLTEAEAAFRIEKSDLRIRPIWHQKAERVQAHILVCFLAYVLWKTLGRWCHEGNLGNEPRRVLDELSEIRAVTVVLPTRQGVELRKECVTRPSEHQAILLERLKLHLPQQLDEEQNVVKTLGDRPLPGKDLQK